MVWAVNLDNKDGTSTSDCLGFGKANNVCPDVALELKGKRRVVPLDATNSNSCCWTFCGASALMAILRRHTPTVS